MGGRPGRRKSNSPPDGNCRRWLQFFCYFTRVEIYKMNHFKIILILTLMLWGCKTQFKKVIDSYPNGKSKTEFVYLDKDDTSHYSIVSYFVNGKISFKGIVENGKFVGAKVNYYENGNFKQIDSLNDPCDLNECCCNGKVRKYFSNGKLDQTFENKNGIANGSVVLYDSDSTGILDAIGIFENGKRNGIQRSFYKSGKLHSSAMYKDDTLIGKVQYYKENGDSTDKN